MNKLKSFIVLLFISLFLSNNAYAVSYNTGTDKVLVTIISDKSFIKKSDELYVLIKLKMLNGWHTYWENPGDSGEKTKITWTLPQRYEAELENFSSPITFVTEGIVQYGYDDKAYFLVKISQNDKDILPINSSYNFEAQISWMACREECVPEKIKVAFSIPIEPKSSTLADKWTYELQQAQETFPRNITWETYYHYLDDKTLLINIFSDKDSLPKISRDIKFIPFEENSIINDAKQIVGFDGKNNISLLIPIESNNISNFDGILFTGNKTYKITPKPKNDLRIYNNQLFTPQGQQTNYSLIWILSMAFIGGLILNLMPCILPILTLKAISLVQSAHNEKESKIEAFMYFLGVVFSFLAIATFLIVLRVNGEKIGWGFQMQSPIFIIVMIIIFFIIFLLLLDIITIKNPFNSVGRVSFKHKRFNSFFTGLFSVLIASPCTAPFMGVAIAYTLSQPLYIFYPVFFILGLGYALPFTLIGFFPKIMQKLLPKPGRWMATLKKIFSIPILLTCIWLIWILNNQINIVEIRNEANNQLEWRTYNNEEINELVNNGQAVFIDFTAKWCITCLVNKSIALDTKTFAKKVKEKNIHLYRADWTNYDEMVEKALAKYGRSSIPLYIYYPTDSNEYIILPQLISPKIIKERL